MKKQEKCRIEFLARIGCPGRYSATTKSVKEREAKLKAILEEAGYVVRDVSAIVRRDGKS